MWALVILAVLTLTLGVPLKPLTTVDCFESGLAPFPLGAVAAGSVTLVVKDDRVEIDGQAAFNTRAFSYFGQTLFPGPTIRVKAGSQCQVRLVNALSAAAQAACNDALAAHVASSEGTLICPDVTNLYAHGLHISPAQNNVSISVVPGTERMYTYDIPATHLMGTHWYHANQHGSAALQVAGGLHGMLLVVPSDAQLVALPADIKALYDDKNVYKYDMVLGHMYFGDGDVDDGAQRSFPEIWDLHGDQTVDPNAVITTAFPSFYVVNGQHEPSVEIAAGSVGLFRMVNAGAFKTLVLKFGTDNVCELRLIARDGVFQQGGYPRVTRIVLAPGSRADVAVKCTPPITAVYPFDLPLFADGNDNGPLDPINLHAQAVVFNLHIVDPASNQQWPLLGSFPRLSTVLPSYLTDLRTATPVWKRLIDMEDFKINGRYFPGYRAPSSQRYVYSMCLNSVYEIWLDHYESRLNDNGDIDPANDIPATARRLVDVSALSHPYHQQANHFQIIKTMEDPPVLADYVRSGEWRDTVPRLTSGTVVRVRPDTFTGDALIQTQYLLHGDLGCKGLIQLSACP